MAGFRLGYVAGPKDLIQAMTRLHIYTTVSAPTVSQMAAIEALSGDQKCIGEMRREYDRRRKLIITRLGEIPDITCTKPEGAFYAFPNISKLGTSMDVANYFLKRAKVLVVPGTEFGKYGEGYVRMSYATAYDKVEEAMNRIERVVRGK